MVLNEAGSNASVTPDASQPEPLPSLDDLVTLLMQLEPSDLPGFERLGRMLNVLSAGESLPGAVRQSLAQAAEHVSLLAGGSGVSAEDVLIDVSALLDSATSAMDMASEERGSSAAEAPPPAQDAPASAPPGQAPAAAEAAPVPEEHLPPDADAELIGEFLTESREYLERAEASLLSLESDPENAEAVNTIFRGFHTIKGTSAFLGLKAVSELAHHAESLLSRVRDNEIKCTGGYADLALRSVDMLKSLIQHVQDALGGGPLVRPHGYEELKSVLRNPEAAGISESAAAPACSPPKEEFPLEEPETRDRVPEMLPDGAASAAGEGAPGKIPQSAQAAETKPSVNAAAKSDKPMDTSVRVSTHRLDRLIDMVGELVISQSMVAQDATVLHGGFHELMRKVNHAGKIVRELQDLSMSMRMVPLKATFQKMTRLVRDLGQKSGKSVHLVTEDRDTEIDRNMVDIINDILVHMVRNSVDHGIEQPDVREKNGKDRTGTVYLAASHAGGNVVVEIRDDGAGLNRGRILEKAIAKGLVESNKTMSDNEVYNLIFAPGFSTAERVTDVSGRGVGMDVVRKGVESLRGRIDIVSEQGKGCSFTVRLPLTLAITDGMLVDVGGERYIIPTANIHLSFRPEANAVSTIAGRGEMVMLRGELMPLFRLHRLFNIAGAVENPVNGLLVVVSDRDRRCTLLVDQLLGQQQVVAKSLGEGLGKIQGVSGAAILGDGRVGLILDPAEIVVLARQTQSSACRRLEPRQSAA